MPQAPDPYPVGVLPFERDEGFDPAAAVENVAVTGDAGRADLSGAEQAGVIDHVLDAAVPLISAWPTGLPSGYQRLRPAGAPR